jgi:transposase
MPRSRAPYPAAFREQIVALAREGRSPHQLAKEFEPSEQTGRSRIALRNWLRQADQDEVPPSDDPDAPLTSSERAELRRLRKKLRQVEQEREILAKAAAWFAQETQITPKRSSDSRAM